MGELNTASVSLEEKSGTEKSGASNGSIFAPHLFADSLPPGDSWGCLTSNDLGESRRVDTLPSGKRLHNYEKSSVLIGQSAINGTFCMFTRG